MGNSCRSNITISVDRPNSLYISGEIVNGMVTLNISEGQMQADEIYLTLTGEIGYTTTRTVSNGRGGTTTKTEYHHVPFYLAKAIFARPNPGAKELVLGQGQYSWPFQIPLADHLPPTLNQPQAYPHVRYYTQVVIDKPWYKPNTRETRYLTVFPRVNLLQNPQCLIPSMLANRNRKDITLKGTLNKLGYVPGEMMSVTLELENPKRTLVQRIELSMVQAYQIARQTRGYTVFNTILPKILNTKDMQIRETFLIVIPNFPLPPSHIFQGGLERHVYTHVHYTLKIAVKVEGMFTNFDLSLPITIGTEPLPDQNQQQMMQPMIVSYSANPEQSMFRDDDAPPTYDTVIREKT